MNGHGHRTVWIVNLESIFSHLHLIKHAVFVLETVQKMTEFIVQKRRNSHEKISARTLLFNMHHPAGMAFNLANDLPRRLVEIYSETPRSKIPNQGETATATDLQTIAGHASYHTWRKENIRHD